MEKEVGIKFECRWLDEKPVAYKYLKELNTWRNRLYKERLIGVYPDGIGYGNMSRRFERSNFLITGTGTGKFQKLNARHYTIVTSFNFSKNRVVCSGPVKASSESLTHAMLYECSNEINTVFHVHHRDLWSKLKHMVPTTKSKVEYGTTAMALEIFRLFKETDVAKHKIIIMAGHEDGIITFGKTEKEAGDKILNCLNADY